MLRGQHHEARIEVIGYVGTRARQRMNTREVAAPAQVGAQPLVQFLRHLVGIAFELFGTVLGEFCDGCLGGMPDAWAVLVR
jgi:hypothetical protein